MWLNFSVVLKGTQASYFAFRGFWQGDPLSHFLFSEETLSRGLSKLVQEYVITPYSIPRGCSPFSHILFVDELLIFANGSKTNLQDLMSFISLYEQTSE